MTNSQHVPTSRLFSLGLLSTLAAVFVHSYLAFRHMELNFGHDLTSSLCNINDTLNCDAVAASSYSSLFGIPLALWGAVTNSVLLLMGIFYRLTHKGGTEPLARWLFWLSSFVFTMSVVMAGVSLTKLSVYCIFCILTYALSGVTWYTFKSAIPGPYLTSLAGDLKGVLTNKGILGYFIAIPLFTWMANGMLLDQYQANQKNMSRIVDYQVNLWKAAEAKDFSSIDGLTLGAAADQAKMTIVEFADFRCGHCKSAAPKLHAFTKAHSDVRLTFLNFPLDGECNSAIGRKTGISCRLAKATLCSKEKGWAAHDYIFERQRDYQNLGALDEQLEEMTKKLKLDWPEMKKCLDSETIDGRIREHAALGEKVGVEGTPAVFVNGKMIKGGQNLQILERVYSEL